MTASTFCSSPDPAAPLFFSAEEARLNAATSNRHTNQQHVTFIIYSLLLLFSSGKNFCFRIASAKDHQQAVRFARAKKNTGFLFYDFWQQINPTGVYLRSQKGRAAYVQRGWRWAIATNERETGQREASKQRRTDARTGELPRDPRSHSTVGLASQPGLFPETN